MCASLAEALHAYEARPEIMKRDLTLRQDPSLLPSKRAGVCSPVQHKRYVHLMLARPLFRQGKDAVRSWQDCAWASHIGPCSYALLM